MTTARRPLAFLVLFPIGLCGCEAETGGGTVPPPTAPEAVVPAPQQDIPPSFVPPPEVTPRPGVTVHLPDDAFPEPREVPGPVVRSFADALTRSHAACGLKAGDFQEALGDVQRLAAGTDLRPIAALYAHAARAAHDVKVRPTGYATSREKADARSIYIGLRPSASESLGPAGASAELATQVDAKYTREWSSRDWEEVTYSGVLTVSPEVLRGLQAAEDEAFVRVLSGLKEAGHVLWDEGDLAGKTWRWRWDGEGHIDFKLADDNTFEADLYRDRPGSWTDIGSYSDWGGGVWRLERGRLVIEMTHVGKSGVWGTVAHEATWFGGGPGDAIRYVGDDAVVLEDGAELRLRTP